MGTKVLAGKISRQCPPRESIVEAFDRAVTSALLAGDVEAIERLCALAVDSALVEFAMGES